MSDERCFLLVFNMGAELLQMRERPIIADSLFREARVAVPSRVHHVMARHGTADTLLVDLWLLRHWWLCVEKDRLSSA